VPWRLVACASHASGSVIDDAERKERGGRKDCREEMDCMITWGEGAPGA
jgi:hypothetical protein